VIDGEVTSYFEWMGAGHYRPDERQGSMHGRKINLQEVQYGSDGESLFVRVGFHLSQAGAMAGMEIRCSMQAPGDAPGSKAGPEGKTSNETEYRLQLARDGVEIIGAEGPGASVPGALKAAYHRVLEIAVPLAALGGGADTPVRFQLSLWEDGLPLDAQPAQGWIQFIPSELED